MMTKVECRKKLKRQTDLRYTAADSARLSSANSVIDLNMHAVAMQCLLFVIFLLLFVPNPSAAALPAIEILPPLTSHLVLPDRVAVGADEKIYIADSNNNMVHLFDRAGQYQRAITGLERPTAVAVDIEGRIYIGNARNGGGSGNVEVYDSNLLLIGKLGVGNGEFKTPVGIALDSAGLIYVVDGGKHKVNIYNSDLSFKSSFGSQGSGNGQFQAPSSIAINEITSEILVPDMTAATDSARVQVFDFNGVFKRSFVTTGTDDLGETVAFVRPFGIAVDTLDRIYVTDGYQNVVTVYDTAGNYLGNLYDNSRPLRNPQGIAFAPESSRLFVASLNTRTVETFGIDRLYGSIAVSPQSYSFANVTVNGASANQSFNVSNNGSGNLLIGAVTLTGANASEFLIVSNNCADTTLVPTAECIIEAQFKPTSVGSKSASLSIASDDLYAPILNVALGGNADPQRHTLAVSKNGDGNGTVLAMGINCGTTCSADYVAGAAVTLSVYPDGSSSFAGWSGGGCSGTGGCTVTMDQAMTVTAAFNINPVPVVTYSISAGASGNGGISPAGTISANEGSIVTFEITADTGYRVSDVLVDNVSVGAVGSYSFMDLGSDHTISAEFTAASTLLLSSIEVGEVSVGDEWKEVMLSNTFTDPIVVVKPASLNDTSSAVVRVRNVSAQGFEVRIQEWDYLLNIEGNSTAHAEEQISYIVIERGSYILDDGTRVEAGWFNTNGLLASFIQTFAVSPVVVSSVVTNNDETPVIVQMSNIDEAGFDYRLQEEELNDQVHATETVSFIAWEPSQGLQNGIKFEVDTVNAFPEQTTTINFNDSDMHQPQLVTDLQTISGSGVFNLRWSDKSATSASVLIDQEQSLQGPVSTSQQAIGYLLFSSFDGDGDGDGDGLSNNDEINIYGTDSQLADTDGDGITDGAELTFWGADWNADLDGDGLINLLDTDSDGDSLSDGDEQIFGTNPADRDSFLSNSDIAWTDRVGVTIEGNSLIKTEATGWGNSGAVSVQTISSDGAVEFTAVTTDTYRMLGLSNSNASASYNTIGYALYLRNDGTLSVYENGTHRGRFGSYQSGDTLRVERIGNAVYYKRNGSIFYISTIPSTGALLADAALRDPAARLSNVRMIGVPAVASDTDGDGIPDDWEIANGLDYLDGSDAAQDLNDNGISNLEEYQRSAAPVLSGTPIAWTDRVGITVEGSSLAKAEATGWGNSGAASVQTIPGDGAVEFTTVTTDTYRMLGLSNSNASASYNTIGYALYLRNDGTLSVYEGGTHRGRFGSYQSGDILRVERIGNAVHYKRNGSIFYTSSIPSTGALLADAALRDPAARLSNARMIGVPAVASDTDGDGIPDDWEITNGLDYLDDSDAAQDIDGDDIPNLEEYQRSVAPVLSGTPIAWTDRVGITVEGSTLVKAEATGWGNSGGASVQTISGDGAVEFTAVTTDTYRMLGLSNSNVSASYNTIGYAIYLRADGTLSVYENGTHRGRFGSYQSGDILRVERTGNTVHYKRNGSIFYTSTIPSTGALLADAALRDPAARLSNARMIGM